MMVTLSFILVSGSLFVLTLLFDLIVFKSTVSEAFLNIFHAEIAAGRVIALFVFFLGMGSSMFIDIRLYKNKKAEKVQSKGSGS
ncbi:hypothetical protein LCM00_14235 [Bacillus infantis]|uniref:hypothetical protein n=1 Tax=Bacillus infantis TaxID=324767 RepID=UPI001CD5C48D|nr:hypothetical protein [Bacillus infantis]MCA1040668.1 hypothetical protein [Bacillus infantis]